MQCDLDLAPATPAIAAVSVSEQGENEAEHPGDANGTICNLELLGQSGMSDVSSIPEGQPKGQIYANGELIAIVSVHSYLPPLPI